MKTFVIFIFLSCITTTYSQEFFDQKSHSIESSQIFEKGDLIYHFFNKKYPSVLDKVDLDKKFATGYNICDRAQKTKLLFYSKDSIELFHYFLIDYDLYSPGFHLFECDGIQENLEYQFFYKVVDEITSIDDSTFLFMSNNEYFIYNEKTKEFKEVNEVNSTPPGTLFTKSPNEFYSISYYNISLLTLDTMNQTIESQKLYDKGNSRAKWIANSKSIGFIRDSTFYILDVESGELTSWIDVNEYASDFYFSKNTLYIINPDKIVKYSQDSDPTIVFTNDQTKSTIPIEIQTLFVQEDTLIIGSRTNPIYSPVTTKIKEYDTLNIIRPQLTISNATCEVREYSDKKINYKCEYEVTNTGEIPVKEFSVYASPNTPFGKVTYLNHYYKADSLAPNETTKVNFEGKTYIEFYPKKFIIEGADNTRLKHLAIEEIKFKVSNKDLEFESNVTLFPNPTNDYFYIKGTKSSSTYSLYDMKGTFIEKGQLNNSRIDIKHLNRGTYIVQIHDGKSVTILEGVKM